MFRIRQPDIRVIAAVVALGASVSVPSVAPGQCSQWVSGAFDLLSPLSDVNDMLTFDLDAGGPEPARLIAATDHGVWVWDTVNWRPMGQGLGQVTALTIFNGSLVAADNQFAGDSSFVVRWAGNGWVQLGGAFTNSAGIPQMYALATFQGELIAGGSFTHLDGVLFASRNVARWNGSTWQALGVGVTVPVRAMAVFDLDGGGANPARLYVGGYTIDQKTTFYVPFLAAWTGSGWILAPAQDLPCAVLDLCEVDGDAYMCGMRSVFEAIPGQNAVLARWDGVSEWTPQVTIDGSEPAGFFMNAMTAWNGDVVVVGNFEFDGSDNVLLFNGSIGLPVSGGRPERQRAACVLGTNLFVAGRLDGVAQYNGFAWAPVNSTGFGQAFATIGSRLVVGGNFTKHLPSGQLAYNLVGWNGSAVSVIGPGTGTNGTVWALKSFTLSSNFLIAGGDFTQVGSQGGIGDGSPEGGGAVLANRIAMWTDGLPNPGWSTMGNGFNGRVLAVERLVANSVFGDSIFAAGEFTASGTGSPGFNRIAEWSGSPASWLASSTGFNNTVRALKGYNSGQIARHLIAGGDFTTAGGVSANRIAIWSAPAPPGQSFQAMGNGFNGPVHAIERYNNATYAAGAFTASGATTLNHIARWSGTSWAPVGNGIGFNGTVRALLATGGFLYAAGDFTSVDGTPADRIARFDGSFWTDAESDSSVPVHALGTFHSEVHAGLASHDTSLRLLANAPWIVQQPSSQTVPCGQSVTFQTFPAPGYSGLTFTWRKNGEPLTGGPTGHGSSIALNHNQMIISNPRALDAGPYDCVLSAAECSSVTSSTATLTVNGTCPPCPADTNADGAVDVDDLITVILGWGVCPNCPPNRCASDVEPFPNRNCATDVDDLIAVILAWGACP
jgi:hypothetical protein